MILDACFGAEVSYCSIKCLLKRLLMTCRKWTNGQVLVELSVIMEQILELNRVESLGKTGNTSFSTGV